MSDTAISIHQVEPQAVERIWPQCEAMVTAALLAYVPGTTTIDACRDQCRQGMAQLWIAEHGGKVIGCGVSELTDAPSARVARYFLTDYMAARWIRNGYTEPIDKKNAPKKEEK